MFGGRGPQRENIFVPDKGFMLEHLDKMGPPPLLTSKELDYYVAEYSRNGLGSACTYCPI
jgi:soluble epoxide hydrolase/lipid-phosphate phosphatase